MYAVDDVDELIERFNLAQGEGQARPYDPLLHLCRTAVEGISAVSVFWLISAVLLRSPYTRAGIERVVVRRRTTVLGETLPDA